MKCLLVLISLLPLVSNAPQRDEKQQKRTLLSQFGPATATAKALREAKAEIDRNGIFANANLVWIITDGMSNEDGNPVPVAKQLKDAGIKICATGVGSSINHAEIDAIASPNCTYYPTSFSSYVKAVEVAYLKGNGTLGAEFFKGIQDGKIFGK